MKKEDEKVMVWSDNKGTYKLGYSQFLQQKILRTNILLLLAVCALILILVVGFIYANNLISRLDTMDITKKVCATGFGLA